MKFHIETFGCQMNVNDSELMERSLEAEGFSRAKNQRAADIVIFNTCSVRQNAEDRARARMTEAKAHTARRRGIVVAAGCMAQRIAQELIDSRKADLAIGPYLTPSVGRIVREYLDGNPERIFVEQDERLLENRVTTPDAPMRGNSSWHRWITITHGCENFCTYCIVPHVRGPLISFPAQHIIDAVKRAADEGVIAVTLLGQNVNQYGQDSGAMPFHELLDACSRVPGIARLGFLTSHPRDFSDQTIAVIRNSSVITTGIHLPLQSGSNRILAAMNRGYTAERYLELVRTIQAIPDAAVTTDMIVGFPGETEEDFAATMEAVNAAGFADAFMYAYSPRTGTAAAAYTDQVDKAVRAERLARLIELQRGNAMRLLERWVGAEYEIIIETTSRKSDTALLGRGRNMLPVVTNGRSDEVGSRIKVRIDSVSGATLRAVRL